jgi:ribosomal RNA-processing protein 1
MSNDIYVKLARKLSHVDKAVRDSGLENVRSYLQKRSLPHDEMMLVWKALFYCHWHSDKPLVQQELARSLAGLMADFGFKDVLMFWSCFYETMGREWQGIDRLRLDKFYDLCRCMSQGMFARLQQQGWNAVVVEPFVLALEEHVFRNAALAVTLHFIDYLVSDLVEANCPCPAVILQPVLGLFATCPNKVSFGLIICFLF